MGRLTLLFVCITALVATGCRRDLGECNTDPDLGVSATAIAYRMNDGLPMYEGQAIYQQSCGNGSFCHAPAATRSDRFGAPAGLDFDVSLACTDNDAACATVDCDADGSSPLCASFTRLRENSDNAFDEASLSIAEIRKGAMPPGAAGRQVQSADVFLRAMQTPEDPSDDTPLPGVDTEEGREIVRNWLACGAPVVSRTLAPQGSDSPLMECTSAAGDDVCIVRGGSTLPDPMWSSIYSTLIFPQCVVCHGPANANTDANPANMLNGRIPGGASPSGLAALDLSGSNAMDTSGWAQEAYSAVVGAAASPDGQCDGMGTLVIANDAAASLFVQKLRGTQTCGDVMPPGVGPTVQEGVIARIEEWIATGAMNN